MRRLWNLLAGCVEVRVRDPWPERFLNLCAKAGAAVWDVSRPDAETLQVRLRMGSWERLAPRVAAAGMSAEVLSRRGFPVTRSRLEARPVLLFGLPACLALLCVASLFIWDVRVESPTGTDARLAAALREAGVYAGAFAKGIDAVEVQNELLLRLPEYKWIAVNIRGSRAVVSLREADPGPELPTAESWDLIAERDGIITGFAVLAGTPAVSPGATVRKGDVLVWGYETDGSGERRPVRASAWCEARSWMTWRAETGLEVCELTGTEERRQNFRIVFGKNAQKIWHWSRILDGEYDTIFHRTEASSQLSVLEETDICRETRLRRLTETEAEELLLAALRRRVAAECGEIRTESWHTEIVGEVCTLAYTFEAEGPLGRPSADAETRN